MRNATSFLEKKQNFVQVPHQVVCDPNLTGKEKNLWIFLFSFQWKAKRTIRPSRETVADAMGWDSKDTVTQYYKRLEKKGYLKYIEKGSGNLASKINLIYDETVDTPWDKEGIEQNTQGGVGQNAIGGIEQNTPQNKTKEKVDEGKKKREESDSANPKELYNDTAPLNGNGLDYDAIKEQWNEALPEDVHVIKMTDKRKKKLRKRFKEDKFKLPKLIEIIKKSPFLLNDLNPNLFTWTIQNDDNYTKILEGTYEDDGGNGKEKVTAANFDQNKDRGFKDW